MKLVSSLFEKDQLGPFAAFDSVSSASFVWELLEEKKDLLEKNELREM